MNILQYLRLLSLLVRIIILFLFFIYLILFRSVYVYDRIADYMFWSNDLLELCTDDCFISRKFEARRMSRRYLSLCRSAASVDTQNSGLFRLSVTLNVLPIRATHYAHKRRMRLVSGTDKETCSTLCLVSFRALSMAFLRCLSLLRI